MYDPKLDSWTTLQPVPSSRHILALVAVGNQIYVICRGPESNITVFFDHDLYNIDSRAKLIRS
jgi:hypothetical protein